MNKSRFDAGTLGNGRWDEEEHPRGKDGRFTSSGSSGEDEDLSFSTRREQLEKLEAISERIKATLKNGKVSDLKSDIEKIDALTKDVKDRGGLITRMRTAQSEFYSLLDRGYSPASDIKWSLDQLKERTSKQRVFWPHHKA